MYFDENSLKKCIKMCFAVTFKIDILCRFCICHPFLFSKKGLKHCVGSKNSLQRNLTVLNVFSFLFFSFSVHILGASDPHSGVKRIKYRFRAQSTRTVVGDKEYEYLNPSRVGFGSKINCNPM